MSIIVGKFSVFSHNFYTKLRFKKQLRNLKLGPEFTLSISLRDFEKSKFFNEIEEITLQ